jgi:hypothetical protein
MPYLVYQRTVGEKIIATIWPEMLVTAAQKRPPYVKLIPITEEEARMTINELKAKYPYETYNYTTENADRIRPTGTGVKPDTSS